MVSLASLWLPILVAAIGVFVTSSIIHMATPWHHGDFASVPGQARVIDALRSFNLRPIAALPPAFIGFALALWQQTIWYNRSWVTTLKSNIGGLLYGLVTAGVFAWLWPR